MNKVAQYYRELVASLSERLKNGERDIDELVASAERRLNEAEDLTRDEVRQVTQAVRRDLEEFARSYQESRDEFTDSVFMRVIKRACGRNWRISPTKPSWSGARCSRMSATTAFTTAVKWWGWATWCASSVTTIWRFTRRRCCRSVRNAVTTSSSAGRLNRDDVPRQGGNAKAGV